MNMYYWIITTFLATPDLQEPDAAEIPGPQLERLTGTRKLCSCLAMPRWGHRWTVQQSSSMSKSHCNHRRHQCLLMGQEIRAVYKGPLFFHIFPTHIDGLYIDSIDMLNAFTCISLYDLSVMCSNALLFSPPAHGTSIPMIYLRYPSSPEVLKTFRRTAPSVQPWQLQARVKLGKVTDFAAYMAMTLNSVTLKDCGFDQQWEMAEMAADFTGCLKTRPETPMIHVALIFACWVWSHPYLSKRYLW